MTIKHILPLALVLLLGACAQDKVILLPQPDGSPSAITVRAKKGGEVLLAQPYATAETSRNKLAELVGSPIQPSVSVSDPAEVAKRYKAVNDALPARPKTHIVYFETGQTCLTSESFARLDDIIKEILALPAAEVVVTGHTDSVGSISANDRISQERAELIRDTLIDRGIPEERIEAVGRGKRQLLVPTADGVAEARNRRVEIRLK
jgi:outer membrane protein OmpA-like peptidoglycan-associated protein